MNYEYVGMDQRILINGDEIIYYKCFCIKDIIDML